jgi:hypothetical protein
LEHSADPAPRAPTGELGINRAGTADIVGQDSILRSALETARQWANQHNKGFAEGGRVDQPQPNPPPPDPSMLQKLLSLLKGQPDKQTQLGSR